MVVSRTLLRSPPQEPRLRRYEQRRNPRLQAPPGPALSSLLRRTDLIAVRAEDTTVARYRTQRRPAALARVEELARVHRHLLEAGVAALRARDRRLGDYRHGFVDPRGAVRAPASGLGWPALPRRQWRSRLAGLDTTNAPKAHLPRGCSPGPSRTRRAEARERQEPAPLASQPKRSAGTSSATLRSQVRVKAASPARSHQGRTAVSNAATRDYSRHSRTRTATCKPA